MSNHFKKINRGRNSTFFTYTMKVEADDFYAEISGDWDGDGDDEILACGLGANVDGMFSVWDGDGTRLYAISFLPSP